MIYDNSSDCLCTIYSDAPDISKQIDPLLAFEYIVLIIVLLIALVIAFFAVRGIEQIVSVFHRLDILLPSRSY